MREADFEVLLRLVERLGGSQRAALRAGLGVGVGRAGGDPAARGCVRHRPALPALRRGGAAALGPRDGLRRYRCRTCRRTFNALTGTSLARLRKKECWLAYGEALAAGYEPERRRPPLAACTDDELPLAAPVPAGADRDARGAGRRGRGGQTFPALHKGSHRWRRNGSFEAATCVQVLEYVRAVDGAIAELFRLLRPGGRAVIIDTDWRALVWHSADEARMRRVVAAWEAHCSHPSLPRTLGVRLRRVGFVVEAVEVLTILNSRLHENTYSHGLIDLVRDFVVDRASLEPAEVEAWAADLRELGARDEYFLSLGRFLFLVRRPSGFPAP